MKWDLPRIPRTTFRQLPIGTRRTVSEECTGFEGRVGLGLDVGGGGGGGGGSEGRDR